MPKLLRLLNGDLSKIEGVAGVVTVVSIQGVVLLVLAGVCLPPDVQVVDGFDQDVIDFTGNMTSVCVVSLVRLSLIDLLVDVRLLPKHQVHFVHW